jgi:hypothetical protein
MNISGKIEENVEGSPRLEIYENNCDATRARGCQIDLTTGKVEEFKTFQSFSLHDETMNHF